jgi:hypothetical protein
MSNTPLFKIWSGYSFEAVCIKHIGCILQSHEISKMAGEIGTWYHRAST